QNGTPARVGERDTECGWGWPTDRSPQNLRFHPDAVRKYRRRHAKARAAGLKNDRVARAQERCIARIKGVHRDLVGRASVYGCKSLWCSSIWRGGGFKRARPCQTYRQPDIGNDFVSNPDVVEADG